ncbi:MAG: alpha-N-arabinofuranosidase [Anaerolineae bacterium]|nr:alpha-N-arabinofuranosidase [Anaerolineae bacterium]
MESSTRIHIDLERTVGRRDPLFFGYFLEHFHRQVYGGIYDPTSAFADANGFRQDVIEAIRRLQPSVIRWPGGCFVSAYHWKEGVGRERQPSYDKAWRVEEPNLFGTDEFVRFCRLVGAEPYICTNAGSGTPEEMSDWVEYCNLESAGKWAKQRIANGHPTPHRVQYWSIGNENYGWWEVGAKTAEEWSCYVLEAAKMMRRVDGTIRLAAASIADLDWNLKLLKTAGAFLDFVAIHAYIAHNETPYLSALGQFGRIEADIRRVEYLLGLLDLSDKVKIAFDEWNPRFWYHPSFTNVNPNIGERDLNDDNATYTMLDAVLHGRFLNACLRHCSSVRMTNLSPIVNTRGPIYTYSGGLVLRPTYHVCDLYTNYTYPEVIDAFCDSPGFAAADMNGNTSPVPYCDSMVTFERETGRLAAGLINCHPEESHSCDIWLPGQAIRDQAVLYTINGTTLASFNDIDHPNDVQIVATPCPVDGDRVQIELSPHSVNVLQLQVH